MVKGLSILVVTPFICSASVETVQSLILSESPSTLEHIKEGILRIFHFKNDRKLPFYMLVGPSIFYHISYYLLFSITKESLSCLIYSNFSPNKTIQLEHQLSVEETIVKKHSENDDEDKSLINQLKCSLYANLITDIVLYPFQTVLYR